MKTEIHGTNNMVLSSYIIMIFYTVLKSIFWWFKIIIHRKPCPQTDDRNVLLSFLHKI